MDDKVVAKQALAQKRNVRDLNTRLEMYVRSMNDTRKQSTKLQQEITDQRNEYIEKINQLKTSSNESIAALRSELETISADQKCTLQELADSNSSKQQLQDRLVMAESRNATLVSDTQNMSKDIVRLKEELDALRQECGSLRYKHESFATERQSAEKRTKDALKQAERLSRDLSKAESDRQKDRAAHTELVVAKNEEIARLSSEVTTLEKDAQGTQLRVREEFDVKLADFVHKREQQYTVEKEEWMRIFKEEYNRKCASFKEANRDLGDANSKLTTEVTDLRTRMSKLKQQKTELDAARHQNEEEIERLHDDYDTMRAAKDAEIHDLKSRMDAAEDRFTAKEIQFDELAGIKLQLDAEIELYRSILNEAEEASQGFKSPMDAQYANTGGRNSRKRRRVTPGMTAQNTNTNTQCTPMGPPPVTTPGLQRAAKNAQCDLIGSFEAMKTDENQEMKEQSESLAATPGMDSMENLQFSGLDLNLGMVEIQNVGNDTIDLAGYTLSDNLGLEQWPLVTKSLDSRSKLRIYVGKRYLSTRGDSEKEEELLKGYEGAFEFWTTDAWAVDEKDVVRLYDAAGDPVVNMEISPDMVDRDSVKKGCLVM